MSLQWTFIATFLYTEIALVVVLMLPFISAARWQKIFRSRLLSSFTYYAHIYFNIFIVILVILFFDAIRDMFKYTKLHNMAVPGAVDPMRSTNDMKMFRAQRNFYICGFALLLWIVLRRIVTLISRQASIEANATAATKQAESATATAKKLMEDQENKANEKKGEDEDPSLLASVRKELDTTRAQLKKIQAEHARATVDLDAMKKQASATNAEYDRLMKEHARLQENIKMNEGGEGGKKDD